MQLNRRRELFVRFQVFDDRAYPLNLVAMNPNSAKLWITGLQHLDSNLEDMNLETKETM